MARHDKTNRSVGSKVQWFFFVIVIPTIFAITLTLVILSAVGINVFEQAEKYAANIPGLSQVVSTEEEDAVADVNGQLQETIDTQNEELEVLRAEADSKQATIEEMEQKILVLEAELESAVSEEEGPDPMSDLARSFQDMDPEQAAPIVSNMREDLAVQVLEEVPSAERGEILGEMDPEEAANLMTLLIANQP
ncbi:hypothetical protein EQV77_04135 [Halobacillus fulvus]|nr:hypothetical protein EQV77_04135 [Halobacillus fulvus]